MVVLIDDGDPRARMLELLAERQPAESAADDHDVNSLLFHARGFSRRTEKRQMERGDFGRSSHVQSL